MKVILLITPKYNICFPNWKPFPFHNLMCLFVDLWSIRWLLRRLMCNRWSFTLTSWATYQAWRVFSVFISTHRLVASESLSTPAPSSWPKCNKFCVFGVKVRGEWRKDINFQEIELNLTPFHHAFLKAKFQTQTWTWVNCLNEVIGSKGIGMIYS